MYNLIVALLAELWINNWFWVYIWINYLNNKLYF